MNDVVVDCFSQINKKIIEAQSLAEQIKSLNLTIDRLQNDIKTNENSKKFENSKIDAEIQEIFGNDQDEINELKFRCKSLINSKPTGIVSFLKEIYNDLSKERFIPENRNLDIDSPNPEDITMALKYDYYMILNSTTKKVLKLLHRNQKTADCFTQTSVECVSAQELAEMIKKFDKNVLSLQSAQAQIEKLREEVIARQILSDKAEQDRKSANYELLRYKRETEGYVKELASVKKELESATVEKEKALKDFEKASAELVNLEEKIRMQTNRIRKLTALPFKNGSENSSIIEGNEKEEDYADYDEKPSKNHNFDYKKRSTRESTVISKKNRKDTKSSSGSNNNTLDPRTSMAKYENKSSLSSSSSIGEKNYGTNYLKEDETENELSFEKNTQNTQKTHKKMRVIHENLSFPRQILENSSETSESLIKEKSPERLSIFSEKQNPINKTKPFKAKLTSSPEKFKDKNYEKNYEKKTIQLFLPDKSSNITENRREVIRDGKTFKLADNSTNTIPSIKTVISTGVQYNWENPNEIVENDEKTNSNLYLMHFNPNNLYGLRGDVFYNSKVFSAQSRSNELSSHMFSLPKNIKS